MCVNVCRYVRGFTWEESRDGQKGKGMRGELFFSFLPFQQSQFSQWVKWISWGQKIEAVCQLRPTQCITLCVRVCLCVLWMSHLSVVNSAVCWPAQREVRDGITPWVALCQWACPCLLLCVPESGSDHTSTSFFIYCTCAHQNNELAVNVTDCHLLEGVIGQNILSCHIRWFERWFPNQFNHLRSTSDGAEQHHEANSLWDWTHTRSFSKLNNNYLLLIDIQRLISAVCQTNALPVVPHCLCGVGWFLATQKGKLWEFNQCWCYGDALEFSRMMIGVLIVFNSYSILQKKFCVCCDLCHLQSNR